MKNETIAIVGGTGKTGRRVLTQLQQLGYPTRGLSRNSDYQFDWADQSSWANALHGVKRVYVTYYPDLAVPRAENDIREFVDLAKSLSVKHIVLLSGRGEEGALRAEQVVKTSGLEWNIVRASWFMQNFSESFMLDGIQSGELVLPPTKAKEPFVDADDIADMVVATLIRSDLRNQLLEITGPELLTFDACIETISKQSQRDICLQTVPLDAYLHSAKAQGLTQDMAWLINELFCNVLDGRNEFTTTTIEQVLGRPARSFNEYVTDAISIWNADTECLV